MRARSFANAAPTTYIKSVEFFAGVMVWYICFYKLQICTCKKI